MNVRFGFQVSFILILFCSLNFSAHALADPFTWELRGESGLLWQGRNDFRIPGTTGSLVSIPSLAKPAPVGFFRFTASHFLGKKHEIRLLIAPFTTQASGTSSTPIDFNGTTFTANTPVLVSYKFNSYRIGYRYEFIESLPWVLRAGVMAKIRDAAISVTQNAVTIENTNIGFVPLLSLYVRYDLSTKLSIEFDGDALAAPQGRAEDLRLSLVYRPLPSWAVDLGYRVLEGGAGNNTVYTFSLFHYVTAGVRVEL